MPEKLIQPESGPGVVDAAGPGGVSKLCTHAGCPVGLYEAQTHQLLCPCHQSTFDVLHTPDRCSVRRRRPCRSSRLRVDADGYIEATGDFSGPVGPSFWSRS